MKTSNSVRREILVVEDEPTIANVCQRVLTGEGLQVDVAENGKIAQGMLMQKRYDLCLIDIRTPKMNGKELYNWLAERLPQLTRGVIFTTGDVLGGDIKGFLKASGRPFLPKPFSPDELKAVVREALSRIR